MKTIHERLEALTTTQLLNIAYIYLLNYSDKREELINEIDAAIYCGDIAVDDIDI